jgi:hypothetical protein
MSELSPLSSNQPKLELVRSLDVSQTCSTRSSGRGELNKHTRKFRVKIKTKCNTIYTEILREEMGKTLENSQEDTDD